MKTINAKLITQKLNIDNNLANKYLRGVCKPSYKKMITLRDELDIPLGAWVDISSYISYLDNNTKSKGTTTSLQKDVS